MMCNDENKKRQELVCSIERLNIYLKDLSKEVENKMNNLERKISGNSTTVINGFLGIIRTYEISTDGKFLNITTPKKAVVFRSNIKDQIETISAIYEEISTIEFNLMQKVAGLSILEIDCEVVKENINSYFQKIKNLIVEINKN